MNATMLPLIRSTVLEPNGASRRWLAVLLSLEGLGALAAAVTFVTMAPDVPISLPALGAAGTVAGLLLAGVSGVISIMAFSSVAAVVRRREGAAAAASGVQLTLGVGAVVAGLVNGFDQQIVAGLLVAGIGLLLATASNRR